MNRMVNFDKLENSALLYLSVSLLVASFVFSSFSLTGFSIANSTPQDSNLAGMIFFVLSMVVCFFFYLKNKE